MFDKKNKKGLSQVVTTVLIILIGIVAIVIIWAAVRPIFTNIEDRLQAECITLDLRINSCDVVGVMATDIRVSRDSGAGELTGLRFIFTNQSNEDDREFRNFDTTLEEFDSNTFSVTDFNASGFTVDVAPLVGANQVACDSIQAAVVCG